MSWTEERVDLLKQLWGEGKTAAEIAKALGEGVTRNAVIGKAHRLKLSSRVSPIQQNPKKPKAEAPKAKKPQPVRKTDFKGKGIPLAQLEAGMCRWPNGDPKDENFNFCGCPAVPGLPYCEEHAKIAYQSSSRARTLKASDFSEDSGTPVEFEIKAAANS
ncbi:MAG: GcrA family cell cycle regulator [Pseudomonadota bacterium]